MPNYEKIVKSHRTKQLRWTKKSVQRIDKILQRTASDIGKKLNDVAGTGKLQEMYLNSVLSDLGRVLDGLKADYGGLMDVHLLGSAQIAADREAIIAEQLFSGTDLQKMTDGLRPEYTKNLQVSSVGDVSVTFGRVSDYAVQAIYQRVFQDGLTLSARLWRLDSTTRKAIEDKVVGAVASGQSARDLAKDIRQYLTEDGKGNARYNSMRLARTEINNAHREGTIRATTDSQGQLKSYIRALGWRLSGSHPRADICDVWASQDIDKLGSGNYLPEHIPVDHAHGLCYLVTLLVSEPEMEFVTNQPKPDDVPESQLKVYGVQSNE